MAVQNIIRRAIKKQKKLSEDKLGTYRIEATPTLIDCILIQQRQQQQHQRRASLHTQVLPQNFVL